MQVVKERDGGIAPGPPAKGGQGVRWMASPMRAWRARRIVRRSLEEEPHHVAHPADESPYQTTAGSRQEGLVVTVARRSRPRRR